MGRVLMLRHVLPPAADALLSNYKEKVFSLLLQKSTLINFFLILNHFTFKPSMNATPACSLLTIFYPQYTTNVFLRHFTAQCECAARFHRFSSVQAHQDSTQDSVCSRNPPKKRDTAVDEAHSQQLTEEARKMHLKNGMVCGSQLVTFSLFVWSILNNSCAFHSQGRMKMICHFLVYSKLPLCINSQAALEKAINL